MRRQTGFNLIELMVTLGVATIVLSVGLPSFRNIILDNRLVTQSNQFITSVNLARSNAVRYQRTAIICPSANFDAVTPTCSATTDWSNGWIVWVDRNRNSTTQTNEVISVFAPLPDTLTFASLTTNGLSYDARGFSLAGGDDFTLCDSRQEETGRLIRVNATGRTNISRQGCS